MPFPTDKVTMYEDNSGGTPYRNIQRPDLTRNDSSQNPIPSETSTVEVTISGRVVFRPKKKA